MHFLFPRLSRPWSSYALTHQSSVTLQQLRCFAPLTFDVSPKTVIRRFLIILFCIGLVACGSASKSKTEVLLECLSPDGKGIAVFYREFGGGAAGWQYEAVTVRQPDDHSPSTVLKLKSGYEVTLRWIEPKRLEIGYPDSARVDHWQDWFGRMADGRVELLRLASKHGRFADRKGGCEK